MFRSPAKTGPLLIGTADSRRGPLSCHVSADGKSASLANKQDLYISGRLLTNGRTPWLDGRPNFSRRSESDALPKSGRLMSVSSDISRTSPTVFRSAALSALWILAGNITCSIGVSSGNSGLGATNGATPACRAKRSWRRRTRFVWKSGSAWLSAIVCFAALEAELCQAYRNLENFGFRGRYRSRAFQPRPAQHPPRSRRRRLRLRLAR